MWSLILNYTNYIRSTINSCFWPRAKPGNGTSCLSDLSAQKWWNIPCCASFLLSDPLPSTPLLTHDLDLIGQSTLPYHALETFGRNVKNILQNQYEAHRNANMTKCSQYNCRKAGVPGVLKRAKRATGTQRRTRWNTNIPPVHSPTFIKTRLELTLLAKCNILSLAQCGSTWFLPQKANLIGTLGGRGIDRSEF